MIIKYVFLAMFILIQFNLRATSLTTSATPTPNLDFQLIYTGKPNETESEVLFKVRKEFGTLGQRHIVIRGKRPQAQSATFYDEKDRKVRTILFDDKWAKKNGANTISIYNSKNRNYLRVVKYLDEWNEEFEEVNMDFNGKQFVIPLDRNTRGEESPNGKYYVFHDGRIFNEKGKHFANTVTADYRIIFNCDGSLFARRLYEEGLGEHIWIYNSQGKLVSNYVISANFEISDNNNKYITKKGELIRCIYDRKGDGSRIEHYDNNGNLLNQIKVMASVLKEDVDANIVYFTIINSPYLDGKPPSIGIYNLSSRFLVKYNPEYFNDYPKSFYSLSIDNTSSLGLSAIYKSSYSIIIGNKYKDSMSLPNGDGLIFFDKRGSYITTIDLNQPYDVLFVHAFTVLLRDKNYVVMRLSEK